MALNPARENKNKKARIATVPKIPVVIATVGINPEPKLNSAPQNWVTFISKGLLRSQNSLNIFGPTPKIGFTCHAWPIISTVVFKFGRTSTELILKAFDKKPEREEPERRTTTQAESTNSDGKEAFFIS